MYSSALSTDRLVSSVWAVPPLARREDLTLDIDANRKLIGHIEAGGISTLLYGGNAILYHVAPSEYHSLLELIAGEAAGDTLVIPSVGPAFGTMMDQAVLLREFEFPTAMILPQRDIATSEGVVEAMRGFVELFGAPSVLYIKHEGAVKPEHVGRLMQEGLLAAVKYAVPRNNPSQDDYLRAIIDAAGTERILSGLGDQPARTHMREFGLASFTTGCGCVAPRLCMELLSAIRAGDDNRAVEIESLFAPLEDLRNRLGPITVLHAAIELAGIAKTGAVMPLLSAVDPKHHDAIGKAARALLRWK